jgi:hypothetical protein
MVHSPPSRPGEQEAIDHLVENRSVAVDIDGVIPCLLKHKAENEGEHHPGDRVRIETCDKMPQLLAFTYEVSDLLTLADSVTHDGRHAITSQGLGPHLNGNPPPFLFDWVGEPVQVAVGQVVECLTRSKTAGPRCRVRLLTSTFSPWRGWRGYRPLTLSSGWTQCALLD